MRSQEFGGWGRLGGGRRGQVCVGRIVFPEGWTLPSHGPLNAFTMAITVCVRMAIIQSLC